MGFSQRQALAKLENKLTENNPNGIYITFEETKLDFIWKNDDVTKVLMLWFNGYSMKGIAKRVERNISEVALLIFDLAEAGYIKPRGNGIKWN